MFRVDGIDFDRLVVKCKRSFEVADNESSGRTQDWTMHRDVEGTFYNYNITIESCFDQDLYNQLFEIISSPNPKHTITMPYGSKTISFDAYITKGNDELKYIRNENGVVVLKWYSLSFNLIAIEPYRRA